MGELEGALEDLLDKVRNQRKEVEERRKGIGEALQFALGSDSSDGTAFEEAQSVLTPPESWEELFDRKILDPSARKVIMGSKMFRLKNRPSLHDLLRGTVKAELDASLLEDWLEEEMFDVYSFKILSVEFCAKIRDIVRRLSSLSEGHTTYASLNLGRRPVDLDTIGLSWVNDLVMNLVVRPISRQLFSQTEGFDDLDWRQGYVAGYSASPSAGDATPRQRLVSHTDDSEVTLNVCLADTFSGGALQFSGLRGTPEEGELVGEYAPQAGRAIIHAGRHLHAVTEVTKGDRYALIVWARSWGGARKDVCPCCLLNRREKATCMCGPRWN